MKAFNEMVKFGLSLGIVYSNLSIPALEFEHWNGLWRSLVAHISGGDGVAGSNPVSPTNTSLDSYRAKDVFFFNIMHIFLPTTSIICAR